jgi:hypothetical protein
MNPALAAFVNMASRRLAVVALWGYFVAAYKPEPVTAICSAAVACFALACFTYRPDVDKAAPPAA